MELRIERGINSTGINGSGINSTGINSSGIASEVQNYHYKEKINSIKSQFFSALDDFKKYYVYYNKNPEVDEFQNYYENSKSQLQNLSNQLTQTTSSINDIIDNLDADISDISELIQTEKELNIVLTSKLNTLETTQNGSEILIDDYKNKYNTQYNKNVRLYIGILIMLSILGSLSKNSYVNGLLVVIVLLSYIILIYNLSVMYSFIVFFMLISLLVGIFSFWNSSSATSSSSSAAM